MTKLRKIKVWSRLQGIVLIQKGSIPYVAVILLLGLLSVTWFRDSYLIDGLDMELPLSPRYHLYEASYTWMYKYSRESANSVSVLFPHAIFFALGSYSGFSLLIIEKIWFYFLFTVSGLLMYYMSSNLIKGKEKRFAGLVSALFYMMNQYVMVFRWSNGVTPANYAYVMLPLIFVLYVKGLNNRKEQLKYAFYFGLTSLIFASSNTTPAYGVVIWMILLSYLLL